MPALSNVIFHCVDEARDSADGSSVERVVLAGTLEHSIVALMKGCELVEHEFPADATFYIMFGAVKVMAEEPFVLESGVLHQMPQRRRAVVALEDTVLLKSTVRTGAAEEQEVDHVLA